MSLASLSVRRAAASISMHLSLTESPVARWGGSGPPGELKLGDIGLVGVVGVLGASVFFLWRRCERVEQLSSLSNPETVLNSVNDAETELKLGLVEAEIHSQHVFLG